MDRGYHLVVVLVYSSIQMSTIASYYGFFSELIPLFDNRWRASRFILITTESNQQAKTSIHIKITYRHGHRTIYKSIKQYTT